MKIKAIIIHCSATKAEQSVTAADIDRWHRQRGFKKIGYHFVILPDGMIEKGRELTEPGAHCLNWNHCSIGICYIGGLNSNGKPADTRTEAQKESMRNLVKELCTTFPEINKIMGHRDTSPDKNSDGIISPDEYITECPCFEVKGEFSS